MHEWNEIGYNLLRKDRWLYAFATADNSLVKIGMVLTEQRLRPRLTEVRLKSRRRDLTEVWRSRLPETTHEEAEHIEAVVRHRLTVKAAVSYVGLVDWLAPPAGSDVISWADVLNQAMSESLSFGR